MSKKTFAIISDREDLSSILNQQRLDSTDAIFDTFISIEELNNSKSNIQQEFIILEKQSIKLKSSSLDKFKNILMILEGENNTNIEVKKSKLFILNRPLKISDLRHKIDSILSYNHEVESLKFGRNKIFPDKKILQIGKEKIILTDKETSILQYLFIKKDQVVSKKDLLNNVWGYHEKIDTHTLETHIYRLRQKLGKNENLVLSEPGGYILNFKR